MHHPILGINKEIDFFLVVPEMIKSRMKKMGH